MTTPETDRDPLDTALLARGTAVGPYLILERVGSGGMGVVYAAYDPELDRKVAVKLLRAEDSLGPASHARLLREAQAMARLTHPSVLTVYHAGSYETALFIAMELIDGSTLKRWMTEAPRSWRACLAKLVPAGQGLAAAHAAGIVHRDFKPENVLLASDGRVLVTDFGLAREVVAEAGAIDDGAPRAASSEITRTGAVLGTPAYMAPEQHQGRAADARADQFAFCVALYEALYGERPFRAEGDDADTVALAVEVIQGRVRTPARDPGVPAWLRRVVLRGLAVAPDERWPSMDALLQQLIATPRRRRQLALGAAGLALAGTAVTAVALSRGAEAAACVVPDRLASLWDGGKQARVRTAFLASGRTYAAETFDRVAAAVTERTAALSAAWMTACEDTHVRHQQSATLLDLRVQCLEHRARELDALTEVFAGADVAVLDKAVRAVAALPDVAECANTEALAGRVPLPADPALRARIDALNAELGGVIATYRAGKFKDALAPAARIADAAATVSYPPLEAEARRWLGELQEDLGDAKSAEQSLIRAIEAASAGRDRITLGRALSRLVYVLGHDLARYPEAKTLAVAARAAVAQTNDRALAAELVFNLGVIEEDQAHLPEARRLLEQALAEREQLFGPEHPDVGRVHHSLAIVLDQLGDYAAEERHFARALAILERSLGPRHPSVGGTQIGVGIALKRQGKLEESAQRFVLAIKLLEEALGPEHPNVAIAINNLAQTRQDQGAYEEALALNLRALAIKQKVHGEQHAAVGDALANTGRLLSTMKRRAEARTYFERALAIREKVLEPMHPDLAVSISQLGLEYEANGEHAKALAMVERALAIREKRDPQHPDMVSGLRAVAKVRAAMGDARIAVPLLERALKIAEAKQVEPWIRHETQLQLAQALWEARIDRPRALELARAAREGFVSDGAGRQAALAEADAWLAARATSR